jgi:hypothetical protein
MLMMAPMPAQCADVHRPAPGAEGEFAARFPFRRIQRGQHDHLEREVDADGGEADDGGHGVLQEEAEGDDQAGRTPDTNSAATGTWVSEKSFQQSAADISSRA